MTPVQYWKLKSLIYARRDTEHQAQLALDAHQRAITALMVECGLDPAVSYTMDDATESLKPSTPTPEGKAPATVVPFPAPVDSATAPVV